MRWSHFALILLVIGAAACGSSGPTPPPPPPPPAQVATTVEVHAGDNQTAAPGTATPVPPAVLVRSQSGQPLAGATVTFAVDSGGGSLQTSSATTGADGVAGAGTWVIGFGRNRVRATVGSIAPVFFTAIGAYFMGMKLLFDHSDRSVTP